MKEKVLDAFIDNRANAAGMTVAELDQEEDIRNAAEDRIEQILQQGSRGVLAQLAAESTGNTSVVYGAAVVGLVAGGSVGWLTGSRIATS